MARTLPLLALGLLASCTALADFPDPPDAGTEDAGADSAPAPDANADAAGPDAATLDAATDASTDAAIQDAATDAVAAPVCGNGALEAGEQCDDGNILSHDGCSSGCTAETIIWQQVFAPQSPGPRTEHAMTFDSLRGRVVLLGGFDDIGGAFADTWEFDGTTWTETLTAAAPDPGISHLAFDSFRGVSVSFVGATNQTWEYDGTFWINRSPPATPGIGSLMREMAFDPIRNATVIASYNGETWSYDGITWTSSSFNPAERAGYGLSYDETIGRLVLFGGRNMSTVDLGDTWEWDGAWSETTPGISPPARGDPGLAYHAAIGRTILFGGRVNVVNLLGDTWEYDGTTWSQLFLTPSPPARGLHSMAYDSRRRRIVLYGGDQANPIIGSDTWELFYTSAHPDELCGNGADDDSDGAIDCADPDCTGTPPCP